MNAKEIKASSLNRKILFFGVLFTLLLPALFSISADSLSPAQSLVNAALTFSTYLGGEGSDVISDIAIDPEGSIYVTGSADAGFPVTPGAFQPAPSRGGSASFVAKIDPVNKVIVYSTFLGGQDSHTTDIAVDSAGNAYVTGWTSAQDFPVTPGAFQTSKQGSRSAFVTKLDLAGSAVVYSTYLGGSGSGANVGECGSGASGVCDTTSSAIAVDSSGNAYITGTTNSDLLPTTSNAFQKKRIRSDCSSGGMDAPLIPCSEAFVIKLNSAGSAPVYSTYIGGIRNDAAHDIAVDSAGSAYISGVSDSSDFPLSGAISTAGNMFVTRLDSEGSHLVYSTRAGEDAQQPLLAIGSSGNAYLTGITTSVNLVTTPGAFRPESSNVLAFKSEDGGNSWKRSHAGLKNGISTIAIDPANASDIYAFFFGGIARSSDGGKNWSRRTFASLDNVVFAPRHPAIAYGVIQRFFFGKEIVKTTDAGDTWNFVGQPSASLRDVTVDPVDSSVIYISDGGLFKSTDGGQSRKRIGTGLPERSGRIMAINPSNPSILLAISDGGLYRSTNRGKRWSLTSLESTAIASVVFGPADRSLVYAAGTGIYRSADSGQTWNKIKDDLPAVNINRLLVDPTDSSTLYANTTDGVFRSENSGRHWERIEGGLNSCSTILAVDPRDPSIIYAGGCDNKPQVFVVGINSQGSAFNYVTYLGEGFASSISVDAADNVYVAGETSSSDFPVRGAFQPDPNPGIDSFLARLNPTGTDVIFSTYYGGDGSDHVSAMVLDRAGNAWIAGWTHSTNLPAVGALQENLKGRLDAFIARVIGFVPTASGPRVLNVTPSSGPSTGTTDVTIAGENFDAGAQVRVAGKSAGIFSLSSSSIRIRTPAHFAGPATVVVVNPDGQSSLLAGGFIYIPAPTIEQAAVVGKDLSVFGREFDREAVIMVDGRELKTEQGPFNPTRQIIGRKGGNEIKPGQRVAIVVRNANGFVSLPFSYTRPTG